MKYLKNGSLNAGLALFSLVMLVVMIGTGELEYAPVHALCFILQSFLAISYWKDVQ